jgi:energy-coupling factor transporter ATP-binding protein EcfA2
MIAPSDRLIVLIDGRSGSGKTTLARQLADGLERHHGIRVTLISLDDCYPGWHGLADAAAAVPAMLRPDSPGYRRFDWRAGHLGPWQPIDPRSSLIIEGCGAITPASSALATLRVWTWCQAWARRQAVEARDGAVADWWDDWAAQEQEHLDADHPDVLADVTVHPRHGLPWTP